MPLLPLLRIQQRQREREDADLLSRPLGSTFLQAQHVETERVCVCGNWDEIKPRSGGAEMETRQLTLAFQPSIDSSLCFCSHFSPLLEENNELFLFQILSRGLKELYSSGPSLCYVSSDLFHHTLLMWNVIMCHFSTFPLPVVCSRHIMTSNHSHSHNPKLSLSKQKHMFMH